MKVNFRKQTVETKYSIGDRVCFIDNGALVYDDVDSISVFVYSDGSYQIYYSLEQSYSFKCEEELCPADVEPQPCKTEEV
jgi:alpha-N-acetylglucosamine transferase